MNYKMDYVDEDDFYAPNSLTYQTALGANLDSNIDPAFTLRSQPPHGYPSDYLHLSSVDSSPVELPPLLQSPSFSHDSVSGSVDGRDEHPNTYQLVADIASMPPTPPQGYHSREWSQPRSFKRPYQGEVTPASSPKQHPVRPGTSSSSSKKRQKSAPIVKEPWTMSEDDTLLLKLKDDENLPWKAIVQRFREHGRGEFRVPTLQMRYKRLKEKMRVWDAEDLQFLKDARDYIEKHKWEIISQRMVEMGCKKKIPASTCEKKWKEIAPSTLPSQMTQMPTPMYEPLDGIPLSPVMQPVHHIHHVPIQPRRQSPSLRIMTPGPSYSTSPDSHLQLSPDSESLSLGMKREFSQMSGSEDDM